MITGGGVCAIKGCMNYKPQQKRKSFYRFPKYHGICAVWVKNTKRKDLQELFEREGPTPSLHERYTVCSDHFEAKNFKNKNVLSRGLYLGAIPTLFLDLDTKVPPANEENVKNFDEGEEIATLFEPSVQESDFKKKLSNLRNTYGGSHAKLGKTYWPAIKQIKNSIKKDKLWRELCRKYNFKLLVSKLLERDSTIVQKMEGIYLSPGVSKFQKALRAVTVNQIFFPIKDDDEIM